MTARAGREQRPRRKGKVTQSEMVASVLARFDASDANKDGTVTREERRAARMQMRKGGGGK
jgi:hypothetical protein